jgi:hypothetical protein
MVNLRDVGAERRSALIGEVSTRERAEWEEKRSIRIPLVRLFVQEFNRLAERVKKHLLKLRVSRPQADNGISERGRALGQVADSLSVKDLLVGDSMKLDNQLLAQLRG